MPQMQSVHYFPKSSENPRSCVPSSVPCMLQGALGCNLSYKVFAMGASFPSFSPFLLDKTKFDI